MQASVLALSVNARTLNPKPAYIIPEHPEPLNPNESELWEDPEHQHYNSYEQFPKQDHPSWGDIFPPYDARPMLGIVKTSRRDPQRTAVGMMWKAASTPKLACCMVAPRATSCSSLKQLKAKINIKAAAVTAVAGLTKISASSSQAPRGLQN